MQIRRPIPAKFIDHVFRQMPAPRHPVTGEPMWERGIRFHGSQRAALYSQSRFKQVRGGVRAGKSFWTASGIFVDVLWEWENGFFEDLYWIVGPTYDNGTEEMNHLARLFGWADIPFELHEPRGASWSITFPHRSRTLIETRSGRDAMRIAGKACRRVSLVEAHQMVHEVYRNAKERVLETGGGVDINGTFESDEGGGWFRMYALNWPIQGAEAEGESYPLPTWDNRVIFPLGKEDPGILEMRAHASTPADFMERVGGEPAKPAAAVLPQADKAYHVAHRFPHVGTSFDPERPVVLWSDPGMAHAYAVIAVQYWGNVAWAIDAVYRWNRTAKALIAECLSRPWAGNVEMHVMDFAARQRRAEGPAVVDQWAVDWARALSKMPALWTEQVPLRAGYERHRNALLNGWPEDSAQAAFNADGRIVGRVTNPNGPRLMFDPAAAEPLFGGMVDGRAYAGEYILHQNRRNEAGTVTSEDPIDLHNDAIKAINYGLWQHFGAADLRAEVTRILEKYQEQAFSISFS